MERKGKNYTSKTPQTVGSVEVNVRDTNNGSSGTVTSEGHHERNCSGRTFYLYIYIIWYPSQKKVYHFSVFTGICSGLTTLSQIYLK